MTTPTDPPLVDPKVETQPGLCEEEGTTLEPALPLLYSQLDIEMSGNECWNKSDIMLVNQIQNAASYS